MFVYMSHTVTMARELPNPESRIEIGKRLKLLREALQATQGTMARHAGLTSASAWTNYELGDRRIHLDNALKLKATLGVSIAYTYHGDMSGLPVHLAEKIHALMVLGGSRGSQKPRG